MVYTGGLFADAALVLMMTNEDQLRAELDAVYASSSWKITAPLRLFAQMLKRGGWQKLRTDTKKLIQKMRNLSRESQAVLPRHEAERLGIEGKRIMQELQSRIKHNKQLDS